MIKIAFCGLGFFGSPMASNLARHGYSVTGWHHPLDLSLVRKAAAAEVHVVSSLAEAVKEADYIFTCINDIQIEELILEEGGIADHAKSNALTIDCGVETYPVTPFAQQVQERNLRLIKAEISGTRAAADQGELTINVKGNHQWIQECWALFNVMATTIKVDQN